jgi:hypothetical protein
MPIDPTFTFEPLYGPPYEASRRVEMFREIAFRRQAISRLEAPGFDLPAEAAVD